MLHPRRDTALVSAPQVHWPITPPHPAPPDLPQAALAKKTAAAETSPQIIVQNQIPRGSEPSGDTGGLHTPGPVALSYFADGGQPPQFYGSRQSDGLQSGPARAWRGHAPAFEHQYGAEFYPNCPPMAHVVSNPWANPWVPTPSGQETPYGGEQTQLAWSRPPWGLAQAQAQAPPPHAMAPTPTQAMAPLMQAQWSWPAASQQASVRGRHRSTRRCL